MVKGNRAFFSDIHSINNRGITMAFVNPSNNNKASSPATEQTVAGYLNISVMGSDGTVKRLNGGRGLQLRKEHPVEAAIAKFCEEHPERIQDLVGRIVLSYGKAADGTESFDLGL